MPHPLTGREILFTRQSHDAKRAGFHYDYRLVLGSHAYSWATKKSLPKIGESIILYEQPVHTRDYALRKRLTIPEGNYGTGTVSLDFIRKAKVEPETEDGKIVFTVTSGGEKNRFLIKKLDSAKFSDKSWLFKNLGVKPENKYLKKINGK
jgi:hypothetical protein